METPTAWEEEEAVLDGVEHLIAPGEDSRCDPVCASDGHFVLGCGGVLADKAPELADTV